MLRESYKAGMIQDDMWMEMLKVRNQLAHDYDGVIVKEYCQRIIHEYIDKLYEFRRQVCGTVLAENQPEGKLEENQ